MHFSIFISVMAIYPMREAATATVERKVFQCRSCDCRCVCEKLEGIDYEFALKAMLKDAMVPPEITRKRRPRGLTDYNTLGYVSTSYVRAGTRTVEYAYDDYCLAQVAKGLGRMDEYQRFMKQSNNCRIFGETSKTTEREDSSCRKTHPAMGRQYCMQR